jgi:hypothetical protein
MTEQFVEFDFNDGWSGTGALAWFDEVLTFSHCTREPDGTITDPDEGNAVIGTWKLVSS